MADDTKIPADAVDPNGSDLVAPLQTVLRQISVLPKKGEIAHVGLFGGTPDSVAVIEAGATTFSKAGATAIGALGGGGVILAAVQGFWNGQQGAMRIVLVSCFTGFLIGLLAALAVIISADVRGRASASVAQYNARSAVTVEFLRAVQRAAAGNDTALSDAALGGQTIDLAAAEAAGTRTARTGNGNRASRSARTRNRDAAESASRLPTKP